MTQIPLFSKYIKKQQQNQLTAWYSSDNAASRDQIIIFYAQHLQIQQSKNNYYYPMEQELFQTEVEYLLVLDFEATCIEDKKPQPCPEIIEFPVVVVHAYTGKILDKFHEYVKPKFNPILTKFCTELTGITQEMVEHRSYIQDVLVRLEKWFASLPYLKEDNYTFVTCGDWDLSNCLKNEAKHKKLNIRPFLRSYINIKKYFDIVMKNQKKVSGMMEMISALGLKHGGKHHSGIDDVLNICSICVELIRAHGATFPKKQINKVKYYVAAEPEIEYLLVLDFEATCIKDQKIYPCPQIIEFPVIVIDIHKRQKIGKFHKYIMPKFNPQLSNFCTELTGITQDMIKNGKSIEQTLEELDKWIQSFPNLNANNFAFVTCGDWDLNTCLRLEAKNKNIKLKDYFKRYINIKKYFFKLVKVRERVNGMMDMLKVLGIKHEGKHHSGIDDVANISNICIELISKKNATFPKTEINAIQF